VSEQPRAAQVAAAVISTLAPDGGGKPFAEADQPLFEVARAWQMRGAQHQWGEAHGAVGGMPLGYISDLLARAAAGGEQLALAFAALKDAEQWRDTSVEPKSASRRSLAGRALAEVAGLWSLSAGHAAVNVVARVVCIPERALEMGKMRWSGLPTPFDMNPRVNLSLSRDTTKYIRAAARKTGDAALKDLVAPLTQLVSHPDWKKLVDRRHTASHRLRPQSIAGGVPHQNPWVTDEATGGMAMSFLASSDYVPPDLEDVVMEAGAGYQVLSLAMRDVNDQLPAALKAVGVPLWREG